ncbi:MAG: hypothetical protein Q4G25_10250 [Paracoccus sp. (in: a-proteobacteria)]|nr:hypothetical protein [Paracoccus sp. (in: a-proteobacteria)]
MTRNPPVTRRLTEPQRHLPGTCRPSGWIALWRRIGQISVLNARTARFP